MTENQFPKLHNPPVREIVLGIGYKNYLDARDLEHICALFKDDFSESHPIHEMSFSPKSTDLQQQTIGQTFINSIQMETLIVDKNRVTFIDRSKYQGFKSFYDKFIKIFRKINNFRIVKDPVDIGLKVVNEFVIGIEEVTSTPPQIRFLPQIALQHDGKDFAGCVRTGGHYLLRDITCHNLESVVSTELQLLGTPPAFRTLFITDTRITINKLDEQILEENINKMREFKNKIFFANVSTTIKDFK